MNPDDLLQEVWPQVLRSAGQTVGEATLGLGRWVLDKLLHRREAEPDEELATAVQDVADNPGDEDFENVLRGKVKKALRDADPVLLREIATQVSGSTATGERSVAGNISNSTVVTGDQNKINRS